MNECHISFYLGAGRIHIFPQTLRLIGCPKRICFLISPDGQSLLMRGQETRDLRSHRVPPDVYGGSRSFEVSSRKLCGLLAELQGWDLERSYRAPGAVMREHRSVRFSLARAELTGKRAKDDCQTRLRPKTETIS